VSLRLLISKMQILGMLVTDLVKFFCAIDSHGIRDKGKLRTRTTHGASDHRSIAKRAPRNATFTAALQVHITDSNDHIGKWLSEPELAAPDPSGPFTRISCATIFFQLNKPK